MLGICIPENKFSGYLELYFTKPIVLLPDETLKIHKTERNNYYFIKDNQSIRHIPEPVYRVGETYYVKETFQIIIIPEFKINTTFYKSDNKAREVYCLNHGIVDVSSYPWKNKAQMPQTAARTFIKIISCEFVFVPDEPIGYRYEYEIVELNTNN